MIYVHTFHSAHPALSVRMVHFTWYVSQNAKKPSSTVRSKFKESVTGKATEVEWSIFQCHKRISSNSSTNIAFNAFQHFFHRLAGKATQVEWSIFQCHKRISSDSSTRIAVNSFQHSAHRKHTGKIPSQVLRQMAPLVLFLSLNLSVSYLPQLSIVL